MSLCVAHNSTGLPVREFVLRDACQNCSETIAGGAQSPQCHAKPQAGEMGASWAVACTCSCEFCLATLVYVNVLVGIYMYKLCRSRVPPGTRSPP